MVEEGREQKQRLSLVRPTAGFGPERKRYSLAAELELGSVGERLTLQPDNTGDCWGECFAVEALLSTVWLRCCCAWIC